MINAVYYIDEKEYHDLHSTTCDCLPSVKIIPNGDLLIVHNSFIEPEEVPDEEVINQAIDILMEERQ